VGCHNPWLDSVLAISDSATNDTERGDNPMTTSSHSDFDQPSMESLRRDIARIIELRSELKAEELKQNVAASGEAILEILTRYQKQTLRALISIGFSLGLFVWALNAHSSWGVRLALVVILAVLVRDANFRFPWKDRKLLERADLLRCLARGIDNFRREARQQLLEAYEMGKTSAYALDESKLDTYRKLGDYEEDITDALCPVLSLGWHLSKAPRSKYGHLGPVYEYLCDQLVDYDPHLSKYSLSEKTLREMHKACFGEKAHSEFVGTENAQQEP
jgi:hypothetical protein